MLPCYITLALRKTALNRVEMLCRTASRQAYFNELIHTNRPLHEFPILG
jgi:hypothetical protein